MRAIYIDKETDEYEQKILAFDQDFNFSGLYKDALKKFVEVNLLEDVRTLNNKLEQARTEKLIADEKISHIKKLMDNLSAKKVELKVREIEKEEKINDKKSKLLKNTINNIKDLFEVNCLNEIQINDLAEEFVKEYSETMGIFDFMEDIKGFKRKKLEVEKQKSPQIVNILAPSDPLFDKLMEDTKNHSEI